MTRRDRRSHDTATMVRVQEPTVCHCSQRARRATMAISPACGKESPIRIHGPMLIP